MSDARIIDSGYRRYDGERLGESHATFALWKHTLRRILGLGRPARWKLLPLLCVGIAYVPNVVFVGVAAIVPDDRVRDNLLPTYAFTYGFITAAIALFALFVAPEALCPDRRSGILSLYLATPLTRTRYIVAKALAVFTALQLVTTGPALLYLVGLAAQNAGPDGFASFMGTLGRIVLSGAVLAIYFTGISIGASSLTDRKAFASAGIFFFSQAVQVFIGVMVGALSAPKWLIAFAANSAAFQLVLTLFNEPVKFDQNYEVPLVALVAATALWTLGGLGLGWYRYVRLRVTR